VLAELCREVEHGCDDGQPLAAGILDQVEREVERASSALELYAADLRDRG
jgi:hypothetical protein